MRGGRRCRILCLRQSHNHYVARGAYMGSSDMVPTPNAYWLIAELATHAKHTLRLDHLLQCV